MPKILELKSHEGGLWARLDVDLENDQSPIYLYNESDKKALIGEETSRCIGIINAVRYGQIYNDPRSILAWIKSGDWYLEKDDEQ